MRRRRGWVRRAGAAAGRWFDTLGTFAKALALLGALLTAASGVGLFFLNFERDYGVIAKRTNLVRIERLDSSLAAQRMEYTGTLTPLLEEQREMQQWRFCRDYRKGQREVLGLEEKLAGRTGTATDRLKLDEVRGELAALRTALGQLAERRRLPSGTPLCPRGD